MLLLICEDLLDDIAGSGIVSGSCGLGRCVELRASMTLQPHVVVEDLAHGYADGGHLDRECGRAVEIDESTKKRADRYRLIGGVYTHRIGETVQALCLDQSDMRLMLGAGSPDPTKQPVQDREYRVVSGTSCCRHAGAPY